MDLNHLYSQHQISIMRAAGTPSRLDRTSYLATAGSFAKRIRNYQLEIGAPAFAGWPRGADDECRLAEQAMGLAV
jgi:hypothetical protein